MAIPNWLTLSQTAGTGNATITVSASSYSELMERSAALTVSGTSASSIITIFQEHDNSIIVFPSGLSFSYNAGTISEQKTVTVSSVAAWELVSKPNYISVSMMSGIGENTIYITAEDNTGATRTGTIDIVSGGKHRYISVTQQMSMVTEPLTFIFSDSGYICFYTPAVSEFYTKPSIEYSKNDGPWTTMQTGHIDITNPDSSYIDVVAGDTIKLRANNDFTYTLRNDTHADPQYSEIIARAFCEVRGNIMSLVYGSGFTGQTEFLETYQNRFSNSLFFGSYITSAKDLYIPSANKWAAYVLMFGYNYYLVDAPSILPATDLAYECYDEMFDLCTSLTHPPILPATTLADYCYGGMFDRCTSLTSAPALPATTLDDYCYYEMFAGCTGLTAAPELPATTLAASCYRSMFSGCTSLTTAPDELPATALSNNCYRGMFYGCTSLTSAPVLSATTLADYCYSYMFEGCTNLNNIKCLATSFGYRSTTNWVDGVAATGTFTKAAGVGWSSGDDGIPNGWTVIEE